MRLAEQDPEQGSRGDALKACLFLIAIFGALTWLAYVTGGAPR